MISVSQLHAHRDNCQRLTQMRGCSFFEGFINKTRVKVNLCRWVEICAPEVKVNLCRWVEICAPQKIMLVREIGMDVLPQSMLFAILPTGLDPI